jgi:hypothetical protein
MGKLFFVCALFLALLVSCTDRSLAQECSTEKVNGDCTVTVDRGYPVTIPTVQMRRGKKVSVVVVNSVPFENLTLDPQSAQAIAGTDQVAGFLNAAIPDIKALVGTVQQRFYADVQIAGFESSDSPEVTKVKGDLKDLRDRLDSPSSKINDFVSNATTVYLQLQEILSPLPRPTMPNSALPMRAPEVLEQGTPNPWQQGEEGYPKWRKLLLCELVGGYCEPTYSSFSNIVGDAAMLQVGLSSLVPPPPPPALPPPPPPKPFLDSAAFDAKVLQTVTDIGALLPDERTDYTNQLNRLRMWKSALVASAPYYLIAIPNIAKDLGVYLVNINQMRGTSQPVPALGEIHDPRSSSQGACSKNLLGCQVVFSVNAVNEVGTLVASVPSATAKKSIVTITVLYADPIFEVSAGAFFSTLANRSFADQTLVTQNSGVPIPGNVVIAQTIARPTVVPFVGANWRLGTDFTWPDHRRGAWYFTTAIGLNPNNSTAEFGAGVSLSWRSVMFSPLYHLGHDIHLTQGEQIGEVWCNQSAASGSIPKCSGSPPSPSTARYWTGAFGFGISVRVPSVFGASH